MSAPRFGIVRRGLIGLGVAVALSLGFVGAAGAVCADGTACADETGAVVVNPTAGFETTVFFGTGTLPDGAVLVATNPTGAPTDVAVVFFPDVDGGAATITPLED